MTKLLLIALLITNATAAGPRQASAVPAVGPPIDTPQERQALRQLTQCVAKLRPEWARSMLSYPYLSDRQAGAAAELVSGRDKCLSAPEVAVAFRTSGVVGSAAEYFLASGLPRIDSQRLANALSTVAPMNVSEDLALCLAARNPAAAQELVASNPGSTGELSAVGEVARGLPSCTEPGEKLSVDQQALRALVSIALYRGISAIADLRNNRTTH
jgi:hypothetical protein